MFYIKLQYYFLLFFFFASRADLDQSQVTLTTGGVVAVAVAVQQQAVGSDKRDPVGMTAFFFLAP